MTCVKAGRVVLTLVMLTLVNIDFTILASETFVTNASVGFWSVFEASAIVEAGLKMARVMREIADGSTPTSGALALEADVHREAASVVLARKREAVVDAENFKGFEQVRPLQAFALVDGVSCHCKSGCLVGAFETVICPSSVLEIAQRTSEAGFQSCV